MAKTWFQFVPEEDRKGHIKGTLWRPQEVELDMHDDITLNRVYVLPDHTLVIKDFQPGEHEVVDASTLSKLMCVYVCDRHHARPAMLYALCHNIVTSIL